VVCPHTNEVDLTPALVEATHKRCVSERRGGGVIRLQFSLPQVALFALVAAFLLGRYVAELLRLFDEHKGKHGCGNAELELY
jgi:hypothetical protein